MEGESCKEIGSIARARRDNAIPSAYSLPYEPVSKLSQNVTTVPRTSNHFTLEEIEIVESEAEDILLKIREKIWTSLEVTEAFCKAATAAQQLV
jgi:amidase